MKKIFALILTLVMVFSMAAIPAFAATIETATGSDSHEVKATYNAGSSGTTIYSVTIAWDEMNFTYNDGAWDPETHKYNANWSAGNTITVTNHSNTDINAELTYTPAGNYTGIEGHFDNSTLSLDSAVGTPVNEAPTKTATLTLSGVLNKAANNSTVGTVTVTIGD